MPYTIQKRAQGGKWEVVGTSGDLDNALVLAMKTERHLDPRMVGSAAAAVARIETRVLDGKLVIWK